MNEATRKLAMYLQNDEYINNVMLPILLEANEGDKRAAAKDLEDWVIKKYLPDLEKSQMILILRDLLGCGIEFEEMFV